MQAGGGGGVQTPIEHASLPLQLPQLKTPPHPSPHRPHWLLSWPIGLKMSADVKTRRSCLDTPLLRELLRGLLCLSRQVDSRVPPRSELTTFCLKPTDDARKLT